MIYGKQTQGESHAQRLAKILNEDFNLTPQCVNSILDLMREEFPQIMWDLPEEQ